MMSSTSQSRRDLPPNASSNWARRLKRELELAGYKVTVLDPARAAADKITGRRRDAELLSSRRATPQELQRKNSVFHGEAKRFRILDYGGLNGEN